MAGEVLREFFVLLGLDTDNADFDHAERRIEGLKSTLQTVAVAAGAVGAVIAGVTRDFANQAEGIDRWRSKIGASTETLSALGAAFGQVGLDADEGFEGITDAAEKASDLVLNIKKLAGDAGESFKALGFRSITELTDGNGRLRNSLDLFKDVVQRLAAVENQGERTGIAMRLFGDDVGRRLIPFIERFGSDVDGAIAAATKFGAIIGEEDVQAAREFRSAYAGVVTTLRGIGFQIGRRTLPEVSKYLDRLTDWLFLHREIISARIDRVLDITSRALGFAFRKADQYASAIGKLVDLLGGLEVALVLTASVLGGAFALQLGAAVAAIYNAGVALGVTRAALLAGAKSAGLYGLAFVALGLVLEDVLTTIQGGDSLISRFVDRFSPEGFDPHEWGPVKAMRLLVGYLRELATFPAVIIDKLFGDEEEQKIATDYLNRTGGRLLNIQRSLARDIAGALSLNQDGFAAGAIEGLLAGGAGDFRARVENAIGAGYDAVRNFNPSTNLTAQALNERLQAVSRGVLGGESAYFPRQGAAASSSTTNSIAVTVNASTNASADEIASKTADAVARELKGDR